MADYELSEIKWGSSTPGTTGGQVTWSFASLAGAIYNFDATISEAAFQALIRAAFEAWEDIANIDFVEVADSANSDIRLGWDFIDGMNGTVGEAAYSYFISPTGFDTFDFAEIRFDTSEIWSTDPNYVGSAVNFFAVALHEIGHALGLDHSTNPDTIMYFQTNATVDLTSFDIAGAQAIYGAAIGGGGLIGTAGADNLVGTGANDFISGLAGNDVLVGNGGNDSMTGGDGNDGLFAGSGDAGNDTMYGDAGNDTIGGGAGNDTLVGGTGSDVLFGGAGSDWLDVGIHNTFTSDGPTLTNTAWAGTGADRVDGDNTSDLMGGGSGNDSLAGYGGNDILFGGADNAADATNHDSFLGGDGDDKIYGGTGNDSMSGDALHDLMFGGVGDDTLLGGSGNDELWGGAGNDRMTGGTGTDKFGFAASSGSDVVTDFEVGIDMLDLSFATTNFTTAASVAAAATDTGAGLQIDLGGGATLVLAGVMEADIANIDFIF